MATSDLYAQARAELADIERQQTALDARRDELKRFCELGERLLGGSSTGSSTPAHPAVVVSGRERFISMDELARALIQDLGATASRFRFTNAKVSHVAEGLLRYFGRLNSLDLVDFLELAGVEVGGKNKAQMVSALLGRDPRFVSGRKEGGWSLAEKGGAGDTNPTQQAGTRRPRDKAAMGAGDAGA